MKTIKITISPTGLPVVEADGYQDSSCKNATRPFEQGLSGGETATTDKPEASIPAMNEVMGGVSL